MAYLERVGADVLHFSHYMDSNEYWNEVESVQETMDWFLNYESDVYKGARGDTVDLDALSASAKKKEE